MKDKIICYLEENLSEKRFTHVMNVRDMAVELAKINNVDQEKSELAALLHDVTKEKSDEWSIKFLETKDIKVPNNRNLYHALTGSLFVQEQFGIEDKEIIEAIKYHTIGKKNSSIVAKIIYVADFLEISRDFEPANSLRDKRYELSIDELVYEIAKEQVRELEVRGITPSPETLEIVNDKIEKKEPTKKVIAPQKPGHIIFTNPQTQEVRTIKIGSANYYLNIFIPIIGIFIALYYVVTRKHVQTYLELVMYQFVWVFAYLILIFMIPIISVFLISIIVGMVVSIYFMYRYIIYANYRQIQWAINNGFETNELSELQINDLKNINTNIVPKFTIKFFR